MSWKIGKYVTLQVVGETDKVSGFMLLNPAGTGHVFVGTSWTPGSPGKPDDVLKILEQLNK